MSRATYEKPKAVVEAAEGDPPEYGDLPQLMETQNVDRAYRELKSRKGSRDLRRDSDKNRPKRRPPAYGSSPKK
jgi:hypothetical protein